MTEREGFSELRMIGTMIVMQYASKFTEIFRFALDFVATKWMKKRRFEEGLAFCIQHKLASQPIQTYEYERAAEVERVKSKSRALNRNSSNQKRKWVEQGASSDNVN